MYQQKEIENLSYNFNKILTIFIMANLIETTSNNANLVVSNDTNLVGFNPNEFFTNEEFLQFNFTANEIDQILALEKDLYSVSLLPIQVTEPYIIDGFFGTFNDQTKQHLGGIFGDTYVATQPYDMVKRMILALKQNNLEFTRLRIVTMHDKAVINVVADIPSLTQYFVNQRGKDDVTTVSIVMSTSYNGSQSFNVSIETIRLICENGMRISDVHYKSKFKNTIGNVGKGLNNVTEISNQLGFVQNMKELYSQFLRKEIDEVTRKKYALRVLGLDKSKDISTRAQGLLDAFNECTEIEIQDTGSNVFALFNGATRYSNHGVTESFQNNEFLFLGKGHKINNNALNEAILLTK